MAGIRDPAFWRRFSVAVHLDEEKGSPSPAKGALSPAFSRPSELKHTDTWLERNAQKKSKMRRIGWSLLLILVLIVAAIIIMVLWMTGRLIPSASPPPAASATASSTPATTATPKPGGGIR